MAAPCVEGIASAYEQFQRYLGMHMVCLACLFLMGRFMSRVNGFGAIYGLGFFLSIEVSL